MPYSAGGSLNVLYVYADECGVMPLRDRDAPFVGAAVSSVQPITGVGGLRFNTALLVAHLASSAAKPFFAHVRPFAGYSQQIESKFGKMDVMARTRKRMTGVHAYLPAGGIALRNMVWIYCVTQAVAQSFAVFAFRVPIARLVVTFDQKTLAPENRRMIIDECRLIPQRLRDIAPKYWQWNPRQVEELLRNLQVNPSDILIQWSDEVSASGTSDGILLADRLAWHYRKHLIKPTRPSFLELLAEAGHANVATDATPHVVRPIGRQTIRKWQQETGLPVPDG